MFIYSYNPAAERTMFLERNLGRWPFYFFKLAVPSEQKLAELLNVIILSGQKVTARGINRELLDYLEHHGLISHRQYGFQNQRTTGDLLAYVTQSWRKLIHSYVVSEIPVVRVEFETLNNKKELLRR
ncbi:unnamed protein product [Acanthoscelides obtectus]|uniref:Uncharacterized protein n=1 Tax=Acanthoscelides obtectus TaxID=200917 RepID=A0A9P0P497_ACAOB|nr:unnamed protein product [Acanthoscelides obtectus]CAK1623005.1 hypothetical protein AOBTE_LOCUS1770 [Acanthoscelides obtectus]